MLQWAPIPLVRVAIVFCGGILLGVYQFEWLAINTALTVSILTSIAFLISFKLPEPARKYSIGFFALATIFLAGYVLVHLRTESTKPGHILHLQQRILAYRGVIADHLYERKKSFKTTVLVNAVQTEKGWQPAEGKVNVYLQRDSLPNSLTLGKHIVMLGTPQVLEGPSNPHEFDFKRFLSFRNIYHQHFVSASAILPLDKTEKGFLYYSSRARSFFSDIIKSYVWGEQEQAIALALVIGVTDGIDNELENAYSASGAMHVLAVSGLHIGILYWIILLILKPVNKSSRGQWLVAIVSLVLLWSYSFVTGLSPSVLRAVTMFSFIALAKPLNARANIFNTLAGSAILLLLFDPYLIMSVGFQLSYLAVLGIIWIQRPLFLLWEAKTLLMSKVWEITCISIAAQLTTFSLGLLYFHQFPTYFLFSNLFVIPLSFIVLVAGIALLVFSFIVPIAKLIGAMLWASVKILNAGVFLVEQLPLSIINNIHVDVFQCWVIMGIVTGLVFTWQKRRLTWLYGAACLAVVLTGARWIHQIDVMKDAKWVVYNVRNASVIEFFDQGSTRIVADSAFLADSERVRFHVRPNRLYNLVNHTEAAPLGKQSRNAYVNFHGDSILFVREPVQHPMPQSAPYVVVNTRGVWSIPKLMRTWPKSQFVLDGSCTFGQLNWLHKQGIDSTRYHSVLTHWSFVRHVKPVESLLP